ncbi:recombinase family protein [Bacillus sp. RO3]|nr:recombinase family protein [Bacillus sp. RO3]
MSVIPSNFTVENYTELKNQGLRDEDIHDNKLFVSKAAFYRWKKDMGLTGKFHCSKVRYNGKVDPAIAKNLRARGVPYSVIQEGYGCSRSAVYRALKK